MCRGIEERRKQGINLCRKEEDRETANSPNNSSANSVNCELCGSRASLYCQADDAFLCGKCDKWVHEANFLALRHIRCFLCNTCQNLTQRYLVGASMEMVLAPIVSFRDQTSRLCDSVNNDVQQCSTSLKMPFLFL